MITTKINEKLVNFTLLFPSEVFEQKDQWKRFQNGFFDSEFFIVNDFKMQQHSGWMASKFSRKTLCTKDFEQQNHVVMKVRKKNFVLLPHQQWQRLALNPQKLRKKSLPDTLLEKVCTA